MARTKSLYIQDYLNDSVMDNLAEILGGVIENIQAGCVSEALKAKNGSGEPTSGSVEYKRFVNAQLKDKGTARTASKGDKVKAEPIIVNLTDDKEIVEELQLKDVKLYGIDGMAEKRKANAEKRIKAYLDRKFFTCAKTAGTLFENSESLTNKVDIIDAMIVKAKNTSSDFIDGLDAEDLAIVVDGTYRKALKNYLDSLPNGTVPSNGLIGMYDSIEVYESNRLPEGVHCFVMLKESIAEPYYLSEYDAEKIPFDDAIALETFVYSGIQALVKEAIYYYAETAIGA